MEQPSTGLRFEDLPVATDRAAAWREVLDNGDAAIVGGDWFLSSREAVEYALRHPEEFSSARAFDSLGSPVPLVPLAIDPPDHVRYRRLLDPLLAPRRVAEMEEVLRAQVRELIAGIAARGECNVAEELAIPYPATVFLALFGLPLEDRDRLVRWKDAVINATGVIGEAAVAEEDLLAALELFEYLQGFITERFEGDSGGNDMLSKVIASRHETGMTVDEVLGLSFLMVIAGLDTVTSAISFLLHRLAIDFELRQLILDDPSRIPSVVEELLRLELPVPFLPRVTTQDVELGGVTIPAGSYVNVGICAANRDPKSCPHPDATDLERTSRGHLTFGGGVHRCLGSNLARTELRLVLEEWHKLIPRYELAPGSEPKVSWPAPTLMVEDLTIVFPPNA